MSSYPWQVAARRKLRPGYAPRFSATRLRQTDGAAGTQRAPQHAASVTHRFMVPGTAAISRATQARRQVHKATGAKGARV